MNDIISKTTFTFVVLHETSLPPMDLEDALQQSYDGHMVGLVTSEETEPVSNIHVADELIALHNDGEFFNTELGLDISEETI